MKITFVRHGETAHNASSTWQGHAAGSLSERGRDQAKALGDRLVHTSFDLVVGSDLGRAMETAEVAGLAVEPEPAWREIDVGDWAGRTHAEVAAAHPDQLRALRSGEDVRLGGGESIRAFDDRVAQAFSELAGRLGEDGHALVVTHGGVIMSLVNRHWGLSFGPDNPTGPITNTSITTFGCFHEQWRLDTYNDAGHLGTLAGYAADRAAAGDRILTLVRHGQTDANVAEIWQGQTDWGLNDTGRRQAERLGAWYTSPGPVFASPLGRAHQTAQALNGHDPVLVDGLQEISMGSWEGLHANEIKERWPDLFERTFQRMEDLKRGGDGESVAELIARMRTTVDGLVADHTSGRMTVVSHGSAIRAFIVSVLGGGNEVFRKTGLLENTALANVVVTDRGYRLADYGVSHHVDGGDPPA